MNKIVSDIKTIFEKHQNPDIAIAMKKYMRNQFDFIGVKKPLRNQLQKQFLRKENLPKLAEIPDIVEELWFLPEREFQYFALDLLEKIHHNVPSEFIRLYEMMITTKSWWDTVDMIAGKFVGAFFLNHPTVREKYLQKWLHSQNIWLQRTCILFQLKYKENTDTKLLKEIINTCIPSEEFFINKAIGWILREYSKTNPDWVIAFVGKEPLANLSKSEALKWLKKKGKI